MSNEELIKECFGYINSFKRHRALEQIRREEGEYQKAESHALQQYKMMDRLELGMRALQKSIRFDNLSDAEELLGTKAKCND